MKLHFHPASTTSRMVQMFAMDQGVNLDYQVVDMFTGEHHKPAYAALNPSCLVPALQDGDFTLCESAAILRYLAEKSGSPAYPKDLQARAKVNEMMDWLNSNLYKDLAYGMIYPQLFPHHRRPDDTVHAGSIAWGRDKARHWLQILDERLIGPDKAYLCGAQISLADYMGAEMILLAETLIGCDLSGYRNVSRWLKNMKALPAWKPVHEAVEGFGASLKGKSFVTL
ncbi:glutathione S-transferase family protein [Pelomonas sp. SE-A7]|uniref:glutathione S-transferase family protein n=1 Tax=Pelomonas sp. SE-A7 TaxID=3054953 RepID=UPI00259C6989|nr:glutathione S-transferase family protein [Pelomonas sp. SE-A7]MDM4766550.1 glutathione S-transferase family protein [Pelomonas sp. SE-A7]